MIAKYKTTCPVCRQPIKVGERMGRTENRWAHVNCAQHNQRRLAANARLLR